MTKEAIIAIWLVVQQSSEASAVGAGLALRAAWATVGLAERYMLISQLQVSGCDTIVRFLNTPV